MESVSERPDIFFRLSPAEVARASCFGVSRGEIHGRIDTNYWRLTPLVDQRFEKPRFKVKPLGNLLSLVQYGCSALAKAEPPGVPILRMNNLQNDGWDLSDLKYIKLNEREFDSYRLVPDDLLFNRTNSKELVGKCEVFQESGDWVFASYLIRVRTNQSYLLPQFASDFLATKTGRLQIDRLSRQIIGMTNINAEEIRELRIPLPPLTEQENLIARMDAARAERKAKLAETDAILAGLDDFLLDTLGVTLPPEDNRCVFAVRQSTVRPRFDPHFHAPEFVRIQRALSQTQCTSLGSVARFSKETWRPQDHVQPTFQYIEISAVNPKTGTASWNVVPTLEAPSRARMRIRACDIIVSLTRPHHGAIAYLGPEFEGCVASTGFAVIRDVAAHVRREYLWSVLRIQPCLRQMIQRASGGNYPAITETELAKIMVPIPPTEMQDTVITEVRRRRDEAHRLHAEAEATWQAAKRWFEEQLLGPVTP